MAHNVVYINPSETTPYNFDFSDDLPGDTTIAAVGSGSSITATKYDGTSASGILSSSVASGMTLSTVIGPLVEGEEYKIDFLGKGSTTNQIIVKVLEVRSRSFIQGGF